MVSLAACEEAAGDQQQNRHHVLSARFRQQLFELKLLIISMKHRFSSFKNKMAKVRFFPHRKRGIRINIFRFQFSNFSLFVLLLHKSRIVFHKTNAYGVEQHPYENFTDFFMFLREENQG